MFCVGSGWYLPSLQLYVGAAVGTVVGAGVGTGVGDGLGAGVERTHTCSIVGRAVGVDVGVASLKVGGMVGKEVGTNEWQPALHQ